MSSLSTKNTPSTTRRKRAYLTNPDQYAAFKTRVKSTQTHKRELHAAAVRGCEVCGWSPPQVFLECFNAARLATLPTLELHHVLPVCCGGTHHGDNLVLLCPNHHAIADVLSERRNPTAKDGQQYGFFNICTKQELIESLRLLEVAPEEWKQRYSQRARRAACDVLEETRAKLQQQRDELDARNEESFGLNAC